MDIKLQNVTIGPLKRHYRSLKTSLQDLTRFGKTRFSKEGHFPIQFRKKGKMLINLPEKDKRQFCPKCSKHMFGPKISPFLNVSYVGRCQVWDGSHSYLEFLLFLFISSFGNESCQDTIKIYITIFSRSNATFTIVLQ